ncbi:unnamed protein product [Rangifer tarandus platyrhynchus]|uniref:Uncharacterized protein n=2 Tax=Rangifer tarandus platyrhynchus TaxID=3082113 RepID=A0ACB0EJ12_RANTA|nr:unnamed protein product [Rangifer tarandus platyrhynchus]CAI9700359.1 unnamed protein product [Rangifer tarandus platyrhynchus]
MRNNHCSIVGTCSIFILSSAGGHSGTAQASGPRGVSDCSVNNTEKQRGGGSPGNTVGSGPRGLSVPETPSENIWGYSQLQRARFVQDKALLSKGNRGFHHCRVTSAPSPVGR